MITLSKSQELRNQMIFIERDAKIGKNVKSEDRINIWANAKIGDNVTICRGVNIKINAIIEDDVEIGGFSVIGENAVIGRGIKLPPRSIIDDGLILKKLVQYKSSKYLFSVLGDKVMIGCLTYPLEDWMKNYERIGKLHECTKVELDEIHTILQIIARQQ